MINSTEDNSNMVEAWNFIQVNRSFSISGRKIENDVIQWIFFCKFQSKKIYWHWHKELTLTYRSLMYCYLNYIYKYTYLYKHPKFPTSSRLMVLFGSVNRTDLLRQLRIIQDTFLRRVKIIIRARNSVCIYIRMYLRK